MKSSNISSRTQQLHSQRSEPKYIKNIHKGINIWRQSDTSQKSFTFQDLLADIDKYLQVNPQKELPTSDSMNSAKSNAKSKTDGKDDKQINKQKKIQSLQKVCSKLFNLSYDLSMKLNKYQPQPNFSALRINLTSSLLYNDPQQLQECNKEIYILQHQITECKKNLEGYQAKIQQEIFYKEIQNEKLQQIITKLQASVALQKQKNHENIIKLEIAHKINQSLKQELSQLKYSVNKKQINSSGEKSDISSRTPQQIHAKTKTHSHFIRARKNSMTLNSINVKSQSFYKKIIDQLEELVQTLRKQLQVEKKAMAKLEAQYDKAMEFTLECQKQLNIKNSIIFQLTNRAITHTPKLSSRDNKQFSQSRVSAKKFDESRRSSVIAIDVPLRVWKNDQPVNLINLLNDELEIAWIDKLKVLYKLALFFEQKQAWVNSTEVTVQDFSGININQNRFSFKQNSNKKMLTLEQKQQCIQKIRMNFIIILDKLLQIPQEDIPPRVVRTTIDQLSFETEQMLDRQYQQVQHERICKKLKQFCIETLQDQQ